MANLSEKERVGAVESLIQDKPCKLGRRIVVVGTTGSGKTTLASEPPRLQGGASKGKSQT